jgi:malonate decarboxylase epsilon subunit
MNLVFLFPGQGAQSPGFLHRLPDCPAVTATLAEAADVLGLEMDQLDSASALASTVAVQLSGLVAGVAMSRALRDEGVTADAVAGLSSGAYTAAVASGALPFATALPLLKLRAELMQHAYPSGYGLVAVVGLNEGQVRRLVQQIHTPQQPLYVANLNSQRQIVLAGSDAALQLAIDAAAAAGARQAKRMAVSVPSHCALMDDVAARLRQAVAEVKLLPPQVPYISNVRARALRNADDIGRDLADNVAHTVRWYDAMSVLHELGTRHFIEMPPGATLTGLAQESFDDVDARSLSDTPLATVVYLARRAAQREAR